MRSRSTRRIYLSLIVVAVLVVGGVWLVPHVRTPEARMDLIQRPFFERLMHMYRSLRKVPDLVVIPRYLFTASTLPTFELRIDPVDIARMNDKLPEHPFSQTSLTTDAKFWVPAMFHVGDYTDRVRVRYRGNLADHWSDLQQSYLVRFPKDHLFQGMREMVLLIPSDRAYFGPALNNYRGRKMGLVVPNEQYVRLQLNGTKHGVYVAYEQWSQEWIEKRPISSLSELYGIEDSGVPGDDPTSVYSAAGLQYWKSWNVPLMPSPPIKALVELVEHASAADFERTVPLIVDLESIYARETLNILAGSEHNTGDEVPASNIVLLFDGTEGRFKPVPSNTTFHPNGEGLSAPSTLVMRILATPKFHQEMEDYFHAYVDANKEEDIAFLDAWYTRMKPEFYKDNAKVDNDYVFWKMMTEDLSWAKRYFDDPFHRLSVVYEPTFDPQPLHFSDSYAHLLDGARSPLEFVQQTPGFVLARDGSVYLPAGVHYIQHDVIVPHDTHLTIAAGAHLLFAEGASLISYSPVTARGTAAAPIVMSSLRKGRVWGDFAVMNTGSAASEFAHVHVIGGGEDTINGVFFSGQLSLHNADATITDSVFEDARGDDGLNAKASKVVVHDNVFTHNSSDGLDLDFVREGSVVHDNMFIQNAGDGIDLSWSTLRIANNTIEDSGDKGVSVGERSHVEIAYNTVRGGAYGVAVKDLSTADIHDNTFTGAKTGIAAYQKKAVFGGGTATSSNNVIEGGRDISSDAQSTIVVVPEGS